MNRLDGEYPSGLLVVLIYNDLINNQRDCMAVTILCGIRPCASPENERLASGKYHAHVAERKSILN